MSGSVDVHHGPALTSIYLRGHIDVAVAADLRAALVRALRHPGPRRDLLVDLSDATDLDPIGVGALIAARDAARDARTAFTLRCPSPQLASALA